MATLFVPQTTDFRGGAAETNITEIVFQASANVAATFDPVQFGPGLISNTVAIISDSAIREDIRIVFAGAGSFSAEGWTFENWDGFDHITISGTSGNQNITGSSENDLISGEGGLDHIDGGGGNDTIAINVAGAASGSTIDGGAGNDLIEISFAGVLSGVAIEGGTQDLGGVDAIRIIGSPGSLDLTSCEISGIEQLAFAATGKTAILGGDQIGAGGIGQVRADVGEADALVVRGASVNLSEVTFFNWSADDTVTIEGTTTSLNTLVGSDQNDTINGTGNSLDTMTGGGGADTLNGGDNNDKFRHVNIGDAQAGETVNGGAGTDDVVLSNVAGISFVEVTLNDVERLDYTAGNSTATLAGDQFDSGEINTVSGSLGIDQLIVTTDDQLTDIGGVNFTGWTNGTDTITIQGSAILDILGGSAQADIIDGGGSADFMQGRAGNDTYVVDVSNDAISEAVGDGTDLVQSSAAAFTLANNVENLTLTGSADINGTGNSGTNALTGNAGNNTLKGGFGADTLDGGAGSGDTADYSDKTTAVVVTLNGATSATVTVGGVAEDTVKNIENVTGGTGADTLNGDKLANLLAGGGSDDLLQGGNGDDTLKGGAGADTLNGGNDFDTADYSDKTSAVVVTLNGGQFVTVTVGGVAEDTMKNVENVNGGSGADKLTGDGFANVLQGGNGDDTLKGGAGADTLNGGGGIDIADFRDKTAAVAVTLNGGQFVTVTVGGVAEDTMKNVESVVGGTAGDSLTGDANANLFCGREGNDTLTGAAAADSYMFNTALNAATNVDHLTDFASEDTIDLENAVFTSLTTTGTLAAGAFASGAGLTAAQDADDRIVYDTTTGALFFDADGVGGVAAVQFAILDNHAALTNADFVVV